MSAYMHIAQREQTPNPSSDKAKEIVRDSMTMDTLFSGVWPEQWSSPAAPEFHDEMDRCIEAGFKVLGCCPSADGAGSSVPDIVMAAEFYFKKINERPDRYQLVRTTADIDTAIRERQTRHLPHPPGDVVVRGRPGSGRVPAATRLRVLPVGVQRSEPVRDGPL